MRLAHREGAPTDGWVGIHTHTHHTHIPHTHSFGTVRGWLDLRWGFSALCVTYVTSLNLYALPAVGR